MSQKLQTKAAGRRIAFPRAFPRVRLVRSSGVTDRTKTATEFHPLSSLRSKRFQSSHCAKVRAGAKKKKGGRGRGEEETLFPSFPSPSPVISFFLLSSRRSRRTRAETLATQAIPCLFSLLVTVKLKPEIISQGDRELIVKMAILET